MITSTSHRLTLEFELPLFLQTLTTPHPDQPQFPLDFSTMPTPPSNSNSRKDCKKQFELNEARKAGLAPAEVDEHGNEINPHIREYMAKAPWYAKADNNKRSLDHQTKPDQLGTTNDLKWRWYVRGGVINKTSKYRKGGAISHDAKGCTQRIRKTGAKWTNKDIAADEKIEIFELDYDGKHDRWNGYDFACYAREVIKSYEAKGEARRNYLKEERLKKLEDKNSEDDEDEDDLRVDETKIDESKQVEFGKVAFKWRWKYRNCEKFAYSRGYCQVFVEF